MDFGLSFLPDADAASKSTADYYRDALDLCVLADQAGLATIKMTEHYGHPYGGYCPDPLLFLTAVAQQTKRIRLMTGCILPAFHHPVQLASRIALADVLSQGRMDIGFGRGFLPAEFEMLGIGLEQSRTRFEAVIEAVQGLFLNPTYSVETPFFRFNNVTLMPRSVQSPHPPFWGAAARARESFAWLAHKGLNLLTAFTVQEKAHLRGQLALYRTIFAEDHAGRMPTGMDRGKVTLLVPLFLHENDAEAMRLGDHYLKRYHACWASAALAWRGRTSPDYPGYADLDKQINAVDCNEMRRNGSLVFGDPARVRERIAELVESFDVDQILWNVDFGAMRRDDALRTVRLLVDCVLH